MTFRQIIALTIAEYMMTLPENNKLTDVQIYMRWREQYHIDIHHPDNAIYALNKINELNHLSEEEKKSLAETIKIQKSY